MAREHMIARNRRLYGRKLLADPYRPKHPPTRGTARKIWRRLEECGFTMHGLWYNANCWGWGNRGVLGWGTWACSITWPDGIGGEYFCGWSDEHDDAYVQGTGAPFAIALAKSVAAWKTR